MDTAKLLRQHNVSQLKFSLGQDHALALLDTPLPPLVQDVFNKQTTASQVKPSQMVNANAQLDKQLSLMVLDVKLKTNNASQLKPFRVEYASAQLENMN